MADRLSDAEVPGKAVEIARMALHNVVDPNGGDVTAANETLVQNALHLLRRASCEPAFVARFEEAAVQIRVLAEAKRDGRPNYYASKLLRLRRMAAAI